MKVVKSLFIILIPLMFYFPSHIYAHPGNTAADGCHYCRTNCDKWGVPWNERHCHNAKATVNTVVPANTEVIQTITTPTRIPTKLPTVTPRPTKRPIMTPTKTPTPTFTPTSTSSPSVTSTTVAPTTMNTPTVTGIPMSTPEVRGAQVKVTKRSFWGILKSLFGWGK